MHALVTVDWFFTLALVLFLDNDSNNRTDQDCCEVDVVGCLHLVFSSTVLNVVVQLDFIWEASSPYWHWLVDEVGANQGRRNDHHVLVDLQSYKTHDDGENNHSHPQNPLQSNTLTWELPIL